MNKIGKMLLPILLCILVLCSSLSCQLVPFVVVDQGGSTPTPVSTVGTGALNKLRVYFIDVGQGDAILIDLASTEILIDGGDGDTNIVDFLDDYINGSLEVMIATHPHADHIGGLIDVFDAFIVDNVWTDGETASSKVYTDFMSKASGSGAQMHIAHRDDSIVTGNLTLKVMNPPSPLFADVNENSIVVQLDYGNIDFLFMGDAGIAAETSMRDAGKLSDIDVLKVGHHGSNSATSIMFLDIVKPEISVYMAGYGNSYGHPYKVTITNLTNIGSDIYGTDVDGTITITANKYNIINVSTEK